MPPSPSDGPPLLSPSLSPPLFCGIPLGSGVEWAAVVVGGGGGAVVVVGAAAWVAVGVGAGAGAVVVVGAGTDAAATGRACGATGRP